MEQKVKLLSFSKEFLTEHGLSPKLLMAMFEVLPQDFKIIGFGEDYSKNTVSWIVTSEEFENVDPGSKLPEINIEIINENGYLRCELI